MALRISVKPSLQHEVAAAYHFVNEGHKFFPNVHASYSFVLLTLRHAAQADCAFYLTDINQLKDERRHVVASYEDFARFNPNTQTAVLLRTDADLQLCRKIYQRAPVLVNEGLGDEGNPWQLRTMSMFHMSNDSHLFETDPTAHPEVQYLPLYEGKLFWQFDHRFNTYNPAQQGKKPQVVEVQFSDKRNSAYAVTPQYWVPAHLVMDKLNNAMGGGQVYKLYCTDDGGVTADADTGAGENRQAQTGERESFEVLVAATGAADGALGKARGWMLAWRDIASATNERTVIVSVLPCVGMGNSAGVLLTPFTDHKAACLLAVLNSLVVDYIDRCKQSGAHVNLFIFKQLPVLPPDAFTPQDVAFICERVAKLTRNADDINAVWLTDYPSYSFQEPKERLRIRAELDAYIARMYGLTRDELRYILDPKELMGDDFPAETFTVLKDKEQKLYGEYLTARLVLEAFDALEAGTLKA